MWAAASGLLHSDFMPAPQVFILSPASCSGQRAKLLLNDRAEFALARQIRMEQGAPLGDVFSFLSGLYFRGKLTYARAFERPPTGTPGIQIITTSRGLRPPDAPIRIADLLEFAAVPIDNEEPRYREPFARDVQQLAATLGDNGKAVLLGSVATSKYVEVLSELLGDRLLFPQEFVGRGDMSRGGLLLRQVDEGRELQYVPVAGAVRRGARPPKLPRRR